ncbi:MAG: hypothetical protein IJ915_03490 [Paludibacteraceae bacterium]|nr:hypothetical protein [Paludibacteraceae bacterium]
MKHIFGVSSHLAFYLCQRIIEQDSLKKDDCIFFTIDGYTIPSEYKSQYLSVDIYERLSHTRGRIFAGLRFWLTARNVANVDKLIEQCIGNDDYIWYTQICFNDLCSVMVTNPHCVGYYVIEDGSGSYYMDNTPTFQGWQAVVYHCFLKPFYPRIYTLKNHFIESNHPKFKGCIASNEMCFPFHKNYLRVVGIPFQSVPLAIVPDAIISIDPFFRWGITDEQAFQIIRQLATFVNNQKYQRVAYKLHPALLSTQQTERNKLYNQWIHEYFTATLEELAPQVSLENTLMAHTNCDFYTAVSTVAIYAHAMGVTCYTYCPLIRQYIDKRVPFIEDMCTPINPE